MSKQARKYDTGLAGEFLVAGELYRQGIRAAVTYGNAKKTDVVAVLGRSAAAIEVKSTSENKWVIGSKTPPSSDDVWVLVFLPKELERSPEYYVLTAAELNAILSPLDAAYNERFKKRHGRDFDGVGVVSLRRELIETHKGAWNKVKRALEIDSA